MKITSTIQRVFQGFFAIDRHTVHNPAFEGPLTREVFVRGQAACVLVYDPAMDTVLFVEEFRIGNHAAGYTDQHATSLGPIAGMVEGTDGALATIVREAGEEAGLALDPARAFGPLSTFPSPGGSSEIIHHYVAIADLSGVEDGALFGLSAEGEQTRVRLYKRGLLNPLNMVPGVGGPSAVPTNGLAITCLFLLNALLAAGTIVRTDAPEEDTTPATHPNAG